LSTHASIDESRPDRGPAAHPRAAKPVLVLAAIGIVYGDIGTSPLYTMKTLFDPANGLALNHANLIGVISLIFWSLMVVVSFKYVSLIMRADNHGEGGIMALLALAASSVAQRPQLRKGLLLLGVFGAALFYGDGVITPAISVLSAVEGLELAAPSLTPYVVEITLVVLVALFLVQKHGTAGIGRVFGPLMVAWFVVLAVSGLVHTLQGPAILAALNPLAGLAFCLQHGWLAFIALGSVVLALTGAEALYADMGHFGAGPVRISWFALVLPALALNYLGQGALLLADPAALDNPFFRLFPGWLLLPMVLLSTVATVIASQAVISGAYSMTKQAIQLGFLPRMRLMQTSEKEVGQIYVPAINWMLLVAVVAAVVFFKSSTALGAAYGIAVTGTMLITTCLTFYVVRHAWHYGLALSLAATGFFFVIDLTFFAANLLKIVEGGWFPLVIGGAIFTLMVTWSNGREIMMREAHARAGATPLEPFLDMLFADPPLRVAGTAIFLTIDRDGVPHSLLKNLEHNRVLHEQVIFLNVSYQQIPRVLMEDRVLVEPLGPQEHNCHRVTVTYGFKDEIDLPAALEACKLRGLILDPMDTSFFLSRATVVPTEEGSGGMALWREKLFATMSRNLGNIADYLNLPANRVIELGSRVEI